MRFRDSTVFPEESNRARHPSDGAEEYFAEYASIFSELFDEDGALRDDVVKYFLQALMQRLYDAADDLDCLVSVGADSEAIAIGAEGEDYVRRAIGVLASWLSPDSVWIADQNVSPGGLRARASQPLISYLIDPEHGTPLRTAPEAIGWNTVDYRLVTKLVFAKAASGTCEHRANARRARWDADAGSPHVPYCMSWEAAHPRPPAQPYGVSNYGAEKWCAAWVRHWGVGDAHVTRATGDGGVDIESERVIAQVKHYQGTVGIADIRAFAGVASADGGRRSALFFTSGRYPTSAGEFADRVGTALFRYDVALGAIWGENGIARRIQAEGLHQRD